MKNKSLNRPIETIWMITREYEGLAGAGGVKDVSMQLSEALAASGRRVGVVMPLYGFMSPRELGFTIDEGFSFDVDMPYVGLERREHVRIWTKKQKRVVIFLIDSQRFREKKNIYTYTAEDEEENPFNRQGDGHFDYFATNVLLQKAALCLMILKDEKPDVIHCQDGHTAILPAIVRETEGFRHYFRNTGLLVTIHNAGLGYHQEVADLPFAQTICGLPQRAVMANLLNEQFDPFLAASSYAVLNTVSENYAHELTETDDDALTGMLGHQLKTRGVTLHGITNGINPLDFSPKNPKKTCLFAPFDPAGGELAGKQQCRAHLVQALAARNVTGVIQHGYLDTRADLPLFTCIGRLSNQKGLDKLTGALDALMPINLDFQVLIMGTGAMDIEESLIRMATHPGNAGRICLLMGYAPHLANQVYAAGDFFLIPSQYEPCGLTDFIAQLFGNLPIVHHVGGLVKVEDGVTGFAYSEHSSAALMGVMQKAIQIYRNNPAALQVMQLKAVERIMERYTWEKVMEQYLHLYQQALEMAGG